MSSINAIVSPPNTTGRWDAQDFALIFTRLIVDGLLRNELSPERAGAYGTQAAHYGRIALADKEVQEQGWVAVKTAFPVGDE